MWGLRRFITHTHAQERILLHMQELHAVLVGSCFSSFYPLFTEVEVGEMLHRHTHTPTHRKIALVQHKQSVWTDACHVRGSAHKQPSLCEKEIPFDGSVRVYVCVYVSAIVRRFYVSCISMCIRMERAVYSIFACVVHVDFFPDSRKN